MAKTPYGGKKGKAPYSGDPDPSPTQSVYDLGARLKRAVSPKKCPACGSKNVGRRVFEPRAEPTVAQEIGGCILELGLWPIFLTRDFYRFVRGWRTCLCQNCLHEWKSRI